MNDPELAILEAQGWRFCAIPNINGVPTKGPRTPGWQKRWLTQDQLGQGNVGVLLGEASQGILAVDFDGPWTWDYWQEHIQIPFEDIDTVTWSSGKTGRAQLAFKVPEECWSVMPAKFAVTGPVGDDGKPQQLEFRWGTFEAGCQSVLPPSLHPDSHRDPEIYYRWDRAPSCVNIQTIPDRLLEFILTYQRPQPKFDVVAVPLKIVDDLTEDDVEYISSLLTLLKQKYTVLAYDVWRNVTWAVYKELGPGAGLVVMNQFYPEQSANEYHRLTRGYNPGKSPGRGTLKHLVSDLLSDRGVVRDLPLSTLKLLARK